MRLIRCWRCMWLNPEVQKNNTCLACGCQIFDMAVITNKTFSEYKHQPDWYMEQKSRGENESILQETLDEWKWEILL